MSDQPATQNIFQLFTLSIIYMELNNIWVLLLFGSVAEPRLRNVHPRSTTQDPSHLHLP